MIPIRDKIPSSSFPIVNTILIVINALAFLYEVSLGNALDDFIRQYGLVPAALMFTAEGGIVSRVYPFFTSMFLHGGWMHLLGNMLFLYIFGDNVEDRMGHGRYLAFYLIAGLGAAFAQIISDANSSIPMVGASGAISGVLGAYILFFPHSKVLTIVPIFFFIQFIEIPAIVFLLIWFLIQLFSGIASPASAEGVGGVAFWAHIGGFVAGLVLAKLFERKNYARNNSWSGRYN